jgi:hypothetical protein
VSLRYLTDDERTADHRDGIPELLAQLVEPASFGLAAQSRKPCRVGCCPGSGLGPTG